MDNLNEIVEKLGLEKNIEFEDIPNIDLYMDQVIQFFENIYSSTKRNDEEKILTKTMINNYAKGKLLFPIKNKKYSKEHIILISLIYQLKGALSINDIKLSLEGVNDRVFDGDFDLEEFYQSYLRLNKQNVDNFKRDLSFRVDEVKEEASMFADEDEEKLKQVLLIASLVNISTMYRRVAEKLVDQLSDK
jgi:hypothetical protein